MGLPLITEAEQLTPAIQLYSEIKLQKKESLASVMKFDPNTAMRVRAIGENILNYWQAAYNCMATEQPALLFYSMSKNEVYRMLMLRVELKPAKGGVVITPKLEIYDNYNNKPKLLVSSYFPFFFTQTEPTPAATFEKFGKQVVDAMRQLSF